MALRRGVPKPSALAVERVVASMCPVAPWWLHRYHWAEEAAHDGADVHAEVGPESRGSLERELDALLGSSSDCTYLDEPFDPFGPELDPMHPFFCEEEQSEPIDVESCHSMDYSTLDAEYYWEVTAPWEYA